MAKTKKALKIYRSKSSRKSAKKPHPLSKASRLFLPYPIFLFVMLAVGAMLFYSTFSAGAIDYTVRGKVAAPSLTEPATITSPSEGSTFSEVPITVSGTCPLDSYVNIYRNNFFSGSVLCSSDQTFSLQTDLFEGANELTARVFNLTDDEGPSSPPVTVHYSPPVNPETPSDGGAGTPGSRPQAGEPSLFVLKTDFKLRGYFVGQKVSWKIEVAGGNPPYAVNVDWGDGKNSLISLKDSGRFTIEHTYLEPGGEKGNYSVKLSASDSTGRKTSLQLFVIVNTKDVLNPIIGSTDGTGNPLTYISDGFLKFLWPAYGVVALMAVSFWLGEREELIMLRRQAVRGKRRA